MKTSVEICYETLLVRSKELRRQATIALSQADMVDECAMRLEKAISMDKPVDPVDSTTPISTEYLMKASARQTYPSKM